MNEKDLSNPKWKSFDSEWYIQRYPSILPIVEDAYDGDVYAYYQSKGRKLGHSPNPYFDEKYYLVTHPDVAKAVKEKKFQSGFDHYCQEGFRENSPHWLFSESYYQEHYKELTDNFSGYENGYDHYLNEGDRSLFFGSLFFNPKLYLMQQANLEDVNAQGGPFQFYLKISIFSENVSKTTWFFDEDWYLQTYPEIQNLITRRVYLNGLHHFLSNETPLNFSPLSDFSEEFYDQQYVDVAASVGGANTLRNGYFHFVSFGFQEGRKPNATLDLDQYKLQEDVLRALSEYSFLNAFEYWVAQQYQPLFQQYCEQFVSQPNTDLLEKETVLNEDVSNVEHTEVTETKSVDDIVIDTTSEKEDTLQEEAVSEQDDEKISVEADIEPTDVESQSDQEDCKDFTVDENPSLYIVEEPNKAIEFVDYQSENIDQNESVQIDNQDDIGVSKEVEEVAPISYDKAFWSKFDEEWYIRKYNNVTAELKALELDSVEEYYHTFGCHAGHSPNPYFDEVWYLRTYPEVKKKIKQNQFHSGFDHYCKQGYVSNSPHWLFSNTYYRQQNTALTDELLFRNGFVNAYDHYLRAGDKEGLSGSLFFDAEFFVGRYKDLIELDLGAYSHYLKHLDTIDGTIRTSWYFDPVWYLQTYPDVEGLIKKHKFINPLHHYLTNNTPIKYSPLLWFDEKFYKAEYQALLQKEEDITSYRNGYDHFINKGINLLWQPLFAINLGSYSLKKDVKRDISQGLYPNIYIHWLANHAGIHRIEDLPGDVVDKYIKVSDIIEDGQHYQGALWAIFDEGWFLSAYPDTPEKMKICGIEVVQEYYEQIGAYLGQSPNAYFDEAWYLHKYEAVNKAIKRGVFKTGFEHYCNVGYKDHQPHWLFSSDYYLYHNPQFAYEINTSEEYVNAYDHYLKKGDALRKTGSLFFDPLVYERYCYEGGQVEKSFFPYRNYLLNVGKADFNASVSLYFDTNWYLERYPEVLKHIQTKHFTCVLQHYFMNSTPTSYDPLPWFSEKFYTEAYPDLLGVISEDGNGAFRNGYQHFVEYGSLECRNPHPDVDLKAYFLSGDIRDDIENGLYRDAFAHWVFDKRLEAWINNLPEDSHYRLNNKTIQSREYFRKKAHFMLPAVAHQNLDFSYEGKPEISVIMLVKNQLAFTITALSSLRANFRGKIQLLIGDNYSTDDTRFIQNSVIGAQITRFSYNFGYGRACNYLLEQVRAPITVFLNNDIYLYPGAIDILCKHLLSDTHIGAVGGKIIHPDGNLQEAGSIIWRDGTTTGYLRGDDPSIAEANFIRDVDFCSGAMLAVKTNLLQQLKGFSPIYYPAYFEDTDLCVRIIKSGYRVVYHPDAVVEHMEYVSSDPIVSSGLIRRNHRKFVKEHTDFLRFQHPRHTDNMIIARQREGHKKRILFIEDRVPLRRLGSGYVRSNDIIHQIAKLGYDITVYPVNGYYPHLYQIYSDLPPTVEVLFDKTIDHIRDFFLERAGYYDAIWIGRTHNLQRILPMMGEANRYLPQNSLILDTEVIAAPRTLLRKKILEVEKENDESLEEALEIELSCARHCQMMITVNQIDADYAKQAGFDNVSILGHMMNIRATPKTFEERSGILFVGALHDDLSPNYDSLQWFVSKVLPILVEKMGDDFTLTIAGYVHPSVDMSVFAQYPQLKLLGAVEDLTYLYNDHRVYIAPTRFAGGIPYKLHESASFGVPIVATELLAKQLGWTDDKDILTASIDNPEFFASQIIRLYKEKELWNKLRKNALAHIDTECNEQQFRDNLQQILTQVTSHK